jgi:hypothetical protein
VYGVSHGIAVAGIQAEFSAPSDAGDGCVQYQWNFGDGSPNATTANASHTFASVGNYLVKLHVRDAEGDTAFHERTVRAVAPSADEDGDGMLNAWELAQWFNITDPSDAAFDPDGDGATNKEEHDHGSDPYDWDTDGDWVNDGYEIHVLGSDPTKVDTDGDGWNDSDEGAWGSDPRNVWSFPVRFLGLITLNPLMGFLGYATVVGIAVLIIAGSVRAARNKKKGRNSFVP